MLPLDVQAAQCPDGAQAVDDGPAPTPPRPAEAAVAALADLLQQAQRPAIIAGRGAVLADAGAPLRALGERSGALLATSAVANGLFAGDPFDLGISGGFATPLAARLLGESDVDGRLRRQPEPVDDGPRHAARRRTPASPRSTSTRRRSARTGPSRWG